MSKRRTRSACIHIRYLFWRFSHDQPFVVTLSFCGDKKMLVRYDFKTRYRNHSASFRHAKHRNSTELSKHIWTLKDRDIDHSISWRIISSSSPYNSSSKRCNLCLKEKFLIICRPDLSSLNKRNELASSCRHRKKALLRNN